MKVNDGGNLKKRRDRNKHIGRYIHCGCGDGWRLFHSNPVDQNECGQSKYTVVDEILAFGSILFTTACVSASLALKSERHSLFKKNRNTSAMGVS